jgi:hypothetical protein
VHGSHPCRYNILPSVRKMSLCCHGYELATCLTHGHLLCGKPLPFCANCGTPLTVSHVLVDCSRYGEDCHLYHLHGEISDMLGDDRHNVSNVLTFLNAVALATAI